MDNNSLSHTKYNCKYHIVFAPKFRRKEIYGELKKEIGKILRQLCEWKGVTIIEAHACVDHIHLFVEIPPKMSVSSFVGYLKGKSSLMIFETVGRNQKAIEEYIRNQEREDMIADQISFKEYNDPFKGSK